MCTMDCTDNQGWQSRIACLVPRRLFRSPKELRRSIWIRAAPHRRLPAHAVMLVAACAYAPAQLPCVHTSSRLQNYPVLKNWLQVSSTKDLLLPMAQRLIHLCGLAAVAPISFSADYSPLQAPQVHFCNQGNVSASEASCRWNCHGDKGSSACVGLMLCSYLNHTGEDSGWPLHHKDCYIQEEWRFMGDVLEIDLSWFWSAGCCKGCEMKKKGHTQEQEHKETTVATYNEILESVKAFSVVPKHFLGTSCAESSSFQVSRFPHVGVCSVFFWFGFFSPLRGMIVPPLDRFSMR